MLKIVNALWDIIFICMCRLKIIFRSTAVKLAFGISILITIIVFSTFLDSAQEKSSIPIGIIDDDNSEASKDILKELKNIDAIYVIEGDYDELKEKLLDAQIYSIIKINEGFSENINDSVKSQLITQYYLKGQSNVAMISDIILSRVIDKICYQACLKEYKSHKDLNLISDDEYKKHMDEIKNKYVSPVTFSCEIINIERNKDISDNISNGIVYRLVLIAIISVLASFIILFSSNAVISDKTYNTALRIRISYAGEISKTIGDLLSLFFSSEIYIIISALILFPKMGLSGCAQYFEMIIGLSVFVFAMSIIFIIVTILIREAVMLQIIGAFLVCAFGIAGSFEMISIVLPKSLTAITDYIANVYLIRIYTGIVTLSDGWPQIKDLTVYTIFLFVIMLVIVQIKKIILKKCHL